jgi:hypothetical protein
VTALCPEPAEGLDIHEVADGLVVYDPAADRVHYLNPTASIVLSLCDGTHDEAQLAHLVAAAFQLEDPPVDDVRTCVAQLRAEGVLRPE